MRFLNYLPYRFWSFDPKEFWKTVKQIMPGQKTKRVTSIDVNGTQIYDDKEIANSFNNFFTKTVDRLVQVFGRCLPSARSTKEAQNQKSCWT